jgi:hypothetical protein
LKDFKPLSHDTVCSHTAVARQADGRQAMAARRWPAGDGRQAMAARRWPAGDGRQAMAGWQTQHQQPTRPSISSPPDPVDASISAAVPTHSDESLPCTRVQSAALGPHQSSAPPSSLVVRVMLQGHPCPKAPRCRIHPPTAPRATRHAARAALDAALDMLSSAAPKVSSREQHRAAHKVRGTRSH